MGKMALLAKPADPAPDEASNAAQLRALIADIIRSEYSGDNCSELWLKPARRAAERIMGLIETMGPVKP